MLESAFILAAAVIAALPADVNVRATVEPAVIPFHQPAQYTVTVEVPVGTAVRMPSMMGRFDGLAATPGDTVEQILEDGRVRITETYTLDVVFPGRYAIESAAVTIGNDEIAVQSPVLTVRELTDEEIAAAAEFEAALRAIDPTIAAPFWRRWWFWVSLLGGGLLIVASVYVMTRRKLGEVEPPKSPWEVALARLDALRARKLAESGQYDRYYVDLSAILRYYIEARFDLHAPERTTQEFLKEMTEAKVFDGHQEAFLASFLKHSDYVKFARLEPTLQEMGQRFDQVVKFVNDTTPQISAEAA